LKRYLLDTDTAIEALRGPERPLVSRIRGHPAGTIGISAITLAELLHGAENSSDPDGNRQAIALFLADLILHDFDKRAADMCGIVKTDLRRKGTLIGALDTLIGAHALALGCTLVTGNTREFARVPDLEIENWMR
jgi:tRNA(fMet)-specific endonuclease VapC